MGKNNLPGGPGKATDRGKKSGSPNPTNKGRRKLKGFAGTNGPRPASVAEMTDAQVKTLGELLVRQQGNVYDKCRLLFGLEDAGEEIFNRLKTVGDAFKCEMCDTWKFMAEHHGRPDPETQGCCTECMTGGDDPDEGAEADRQWR